MLKNWYFYIEFLRKPSLVEKQIQIGSVKKIQQVFLLWFFHLLFFSFFILIYFNKSKSFRNDLEVSNENFTNILLGVVIVAPLLEEAIFRLFLSGKVKHIIISFVLASFVVASLLNSIWSIIVLFLPFIILILYLLGYLSWDKHYLFFRKNYSVFFYSSAILFGIIHLRVIEVESYNEYFTFPIPIILMGILFNYIRITYGFWWSVTLHQLHNFVVVFTPFILDKL
jgi:hypothetical protein